MYLIFFSKFHDPREEISFIRDTSLQYIGDLFLSVKSTLIIHLVQVSVTSVESKVVNIISIVGHRVCVATAQLCHCSIKQLQTIWK